MRTKPGTILAAGFALLFLLAALPVLATAYPPLVDYPNHLARMHLLAALPDNAVLARAYALNWHPLPNLAMDIVVPPLTRLVPLPLAGRGFILLTLLLMAAGPVLLHRAAAGRFAPASLAGFLLLYNNILFWGFLNFLCGCGLAFICLAGWLALSRAAGGLATRLGYILATACLLYAAHLEALGVYGLMLLGWEAGQGWRQGRGPAMARRVVLAGLPFLVPLAVLLATSQGLGGGGVDFGRAVRKLDHLANIADTESLLGTGILLALLVGGIGLALRRGWLRLLPGFAWPLAVLGVVYLAMPTHVLTAYGADHRLPLPMAMLFLAGLEWRGPSLRGRHYAGAAALLFLAQIGQVGLAWQQSDRIYASLMPLIDALPRGARIAVAYPPGAVHLTRTPLLHFALEAVTRRDAFVTTLFAFPTQQPVRLQPDHAWLAGRLPATRLWDCLVDQLCPAADLPLNDIDYIVFTSPRGVVLPPASGLQDMGGGTAFRLVRHINAQHEGKD